MKQLQLPFPDQQSDTLSFNSDVFFLLENPRLYENSSWLRAPGWVLSLPKPVPSHRRGLTMESIKKDLLKLKTEAFPVVSLFLKWYLCRGTLVRNKKIKKMLEEMDQGRVTDPQRWASLLRMRILGEAYQALSGLLERELNPNEVVHLFERIEEFIQLYSMGLKT